MAAASLLSISLSISLSLPFTLPLNCVILSVSFFGTLVLGVQSFSEGKEYIEYIFLLIYYSFKEIDCACSSIVVLNKKIRRNYVDSFRDENRKSGLKMDINKRKGKSRIKFKYLILIFSCTY